MFVTNMYYSYLNNNASPLYLKVIHFVHWQLFSLFFTIGQTASV